MARDKAYRKAEKKIEEALSSEATELDLSVKWDAEDDEKLTELPESLEQLTQLLSLILSHTQLTALPETFGNLTQLQTLDLSDNELMALPEWLGQLMQLQSLDLSGNELTALPETFGNLTQLQTLDLSHNELTALPESLGELRQLQTLNLSNNELTALPESLGELTQLQSLTLSSNKLTTLPESLGELRQLQTLNLYGNQLTVLPESLGNLQKLRELWIGNGPSGNPIIEVPAFVRRLKNLHILDVSRSEVTSIPEWISELHFLNRLYLNPSLVSDLPASLVNLENLVIVALEGSPLNPELAASYEQGLDTLKAYLHVRFEGEIVLNEAKLILVGEGGVGKTSLLAALREEEWVEDRETTHGVEVKVQSLVVTDPDSSTEITLNGWDFGGQNIYRHTHQLFFTAPAVYLAVWEPRRGPEQCRVDEWIKMIKHRAYDEKRPNQRPRILVVATHGGPKERLDHIDEQALRDEFGDLIAGFYHVDSKTGFGLDKLTDAIAHTAASIRQVGRSVPESWKIVLEALRKRSRKDPYLTYKQYKSLCNRQKITNELADIYAIVFNELGHVIHYQNDATLQDIVILKPDYLTKALSFVLEDAPTKQDNGLVQHDRLATLWNDSARPKSERYPTALHAVFLRLMERFDLSYQVTLAEAGAPPTSLVAQLVPNVRPEGWEVDWPDQLKQGDQERTQVCRVLDAVTGRTALAEGLMYRLIVRLHRYSLGRADYSHSRHWKTGLILADGFNGRAFIEEIGGDISVRVRAAYPERFLAHLCAEVTWLVENFWKGLDARLYVPCQTPDCKGLLELEEMFANKTEDISKIRCGVCREFHDIDALLTSAAPKPEIHIALAELKQGQAEIKRGMTDGFDSVGRDLRQLLSQADEQFDLLMTALTDPAKEGPRLFSFEAVELGFWERPKWVAERFRLTLWCEHSRTPLPLLTGDETLGVYEITLTREWLKKAAPVLRVLSDTLGLILPIASSATKLVLDESLYKGIENQLDFGHKCADAFLKGGEKAGGWLSRGDETDLEHDRGIRAQGSSLRELHALLQEKDPQSSFGSLNRVQNKRGEYLWVHPQFEGEY